MCCTHACTSRLKDKLTAEAKRQKLRGKKKRAKECNGVSCECVGFCGGLAQRLYKQEKDSLPNNVQYLEFRRRLKGGCILLGFMAAGGSSASILLYITKLGE